MASSSVRLVAIASLLVMLFMASGMGTMAAGTRMCTSQSEHYRGNCLLINQNSRNNCNRICRDTEGFTSGDCTITAQARRICSCFMPCHC
ncbi:PREDICTED: defensin-like protein 4 [Ipomoea nil]|uniref:defensin-like protein 4 n=1 Tax=Ipomoea nil TaxID=35883 RepID=UPI0009020020|nr:PREDICTED: defensin-like protein 4 [Ipomoea nil]